MVEIEIGKLAEPLTKLIEVVSQGIGEIYGPFGKIRHAKADVKVGLILAEGEIEKRELLRRAAIRMAHVETTRQANIENIIERARVALPETVSAEPLEPDWINYFFSSCGDVSNSDLQEIWARILAKEVTTPGVIPKRTLEFLKVLEKYEADLFEALLSVAFTDNHGFYFVVETESTFAALKNVIGREGAIKHLTNIGILAPEPNVVTAIEIDWEIGYGGKNYKFIPAHPQNAFPIPEEIAIRFFTGVGQNLSLVARKKTIEGYMPDLVKDLQKTVQVGIEEKTETR